ncbi:MAG TPA: Fic family protein [Firmicutes bacterium]|nr:Fic family protein [Bacillota bacterium]
MDRYIPPYDVTDEMLELTSEIAENLGKLSNVDDLERLPRLRRVNRIKSIQSSLAIENNTLSLIQVTDVIDGKRVLGPQEDIFAVKNAFNAYKMIPELNPFSLSDLKNAHGVMMQGLVEGAGKFRTNSVGVFDESGKVIHVAPPCDMVNGLMEQLFEWLKTSKAHMLIRSSIFHYEFEFIHPFADGNGRTGRLWQTALLADWKPVFEWIPVESIIKDHQAEYYHAIGLSTSEGKSNSFILFMLGIIKKAVEELIRDTRSHQSHISSQVKALMSVIETYPMSATELMEKLGLKSRAAFRKNYLQPCLAAGLIAMTDPENKTSRNQRYFRI